MIISGATQTHHGRLMDGAAETVIPACVQCSGSDYLLLLLPFGRAWHIEGSISSPESSAFGSAVKLK
jgi:hypothetical protein